MSGGEGVTSDHSIKGATLEISARTLISCAIIDHETKENQSLLVHLYIQDWYVSIAKRDKSCMLKLSSHSLSIEVGSYPARISRDKRIRIYIYCNLHDTDDEFHFVLTCTQHNKI